MYSLVRDNMQYNRSCYSIDFYVYIHYTKDTKEIFYVGKGINNRAYSKVKRNKFWWNIVNKHDYCSKILYSNLSEEKAFLLEKELIKNLKAIGLAKANFHEGGSGGNTMKYAPLGEIQKWKESLCFAQQNLDLETRQRLSQIRSLNVSGDKNPQFNKPGFNTGRKFSDEHKNKISNALKQYSMTEEHKQNITKSHNKYLLKVITDNGEEMIFSSLKEASETLGVPKTTLSSCGHGNNGRNKTHYSSKYKLTAYYLT